ncbi:MAG: hypothetical protein IJ801_08860, partial [Lachnospiraceae bacterium]|nr:hypothetical protein [Lachnospiraceae bacterium]
LWKQQWKRYLLFTLAALICLYVCGVATGNFYPYGEVEPYSDFEISWYVEELAAGVERALLKQTVWGTVIVLFLQKALLFRLEREEYGRSFLQTLPVKRRERVVFRIGMDCLTIVLCVAGYSSYAALRCIQNLTDLGIRLPWLPEAIFGMALTVICYLFLAEGIIAFWSTLFVNGTAQITGTAAAVGMQIYTLVLLWYRGTGMEWIRQLYGFFFLKAVGNCHYLSVLPDSLGGMDDLSLHWLPDPAYPPVYYKGVLWEDYMQYDIQFSHTRLYHFTHLSSYIGYALAYLGLAILLIVLSVWLSGKQELSQNGFYFSFGRYLFSILFCIAFWVTSFSGENRLWHKGLVSLATLLLFVVLVYAMSDKAYRRLEDTGASG